MLVDCGGELGEGVYVRTTVRCEHARRNGAASEHASGKREEEQRGTRCRSVQGKHRGHERGTGRPMRA